ncbi:MAG: DUF2975 domain-containing protein [Aliishimia sp.]
MVITSRTTSRALPHLRLARTGVWATSLALCIACVAFDFFIVGAASDQIVLSNDIIEDFGISDHVDQLTGPRLWIGTFFWAWVDMLGLYMLWSIRKLFIAYRDGSVFSPDSARKLRHIGWVILAMAPASMLGTFLGGMWLSAWATRSSVHGQIAIEDTDIYAIIIGLVIVSVGHVMTLAADLDAENRAFV